MQRSERDEGKQHRPRQTELPFGCRFLPLSAKEGEVEEEEEGPSSLLIPLCSTRRRLFFFGWTASKSSSSQSSAMYSSSGTRADLALGGTGGVLEKCGCGRPWSRVWALPRPLMALWYSSCADKDGARGRSLAFSRAWEGTRSASLFWGGSLWLGAAGTACLGRTGRRGLTGLSESLLSSEELLLFYSTHIHAHACFCACRKNLQSHKI